MRLRQLQPATPEAASSASWLIQALPRDLFTPDGGAISTFAATTQLLHPASDADGAPVTWAQVAAHTGHRLDPTSTWEDVSGTVRTRRTTRDDWPGGPPELGELGEPGWNVLLSHLTRWSGSTNTCMVAIDESLPWVTGNGIGFYGNPHHIEPPQGPAFPAQVLTAAPRLPLLSTCLLFAGPLGAVQTLGRTRHYQDHHWFEPHGPTALWPSDRSWLVVTDLDADCTVVAGPRALISAVSTDAQLEVRPQPSP